ncbi:hypothetical protein [Streptomyces globisporus]|uniref:hypothetical protein n=1 Tax=Streptomyces globisporus TaxID=1908 RepID=UPI0037A02A5B
MAVTAGIDPRVLLLITEAFRHHKAIGAWADGLDARFPSSRDQRDHSGVQHRPADRADAGQVLAAGGDDADDPAVPRPPAARRIGGTPQLNDPGQPRKLSRTWRSGLSRFVSTKPR